MFFVHFWRIPVAGMGRGAVTGFVFDGGLLDEPNLVGECSPGEIRVAAFRARAGAWDKLLPRYTGHRGGHRRRRAGRHVVVGAGMG